MSRTLCVTICNQVSQEFDNASGRSKDITPPSNNPNNGNTRSKGGTWISAANHSFGLVQQWAYAACGIKFGKSGYMGRIMLGRTRVGGVTL
jgi:hypothetical protein